MFLLQNETEKKTFSKSSIANISGTRENPKKLEKEPWIAVK